MSREAAEDGRPDVAEEIERAAMASESAESGEACVTDEASEPLDPHAAPVTDVAARPNNRPVADDRAVFDHGIGAYCYARSQSS